MEVKIEEILSYCIPYCGNKRVLPYATLLVNDGINSYSVKTKEDKHGNRYFTLNRKRFYIENTGTLYAPVFIIKS